MGYNDENEDTRESEAMRKLFVGGLNRSTQEDSFFEHFSQFGEIVDKVIIVDPHTKESRGFGFITYSSSQSVENAFKNRPHTIDNKPLDIKRAMPREFNTAGAHAKTKKLFIGGIAPDTTEDTLRTYIESRHSTDIGKIESVFIATDKETGKNKGFGFLDCSDNDFADRLAISESTCHISGKKMNIKKAEPREGDENAGGGRGGGRGGMRGGGRGRGSDRGGGRGGFSRGGRGGGRGGYGGNDYAQNNQSYSTAYPMQQNTGYGAGAGGYGAAGGYGQQDQGYGGGYGQAAAGGYGGYSQGGDGGYGQGGGGYGAKPRGGAQGGAQRYQPY